MIANHGDATGRPIGLRARGRRPLTRRVGPQVQEISAEDRRVLAGVGLIEVDVVDGARPAGLLLARKHVIFVLAIQVAEQLLRRGRCTRVDWCHAAARARRPTPSRAPSAGAAASVSAGRADLRRSFLRRSFLRRLHRLSSFHQGSCRLRPCRPGCCQRHHRPLRSFRQRLHCSPPCLRRSRPRRHQGRRCRRGFARRNPRDPCPRLSYAHPSQRHPSSSGPDLPSCRRFHCKRCSRLQRAGKGSRPDEGSST